MIGKPGIRAGRSLKCKAGLFSRRAAVGQHARHAQAAPEAAEAIGFGSGCASGLQGSQLAGYLVFLSGPAESSRCR
jgi:hypothetical protein